MRPFNTVEYLAGLERRGIHLGLGPVRRLLHRLHNPQDTFRSIIVGGTNGKGSTAASLASILQAAHFRVGLYTSPHLVDVTERIRVNGVIIGKNAFSRLAGEVSRKDDGHVTYFEFLTALAFLWFARLRVDIAVLEVGMGGRLDAVNTVLPEVSVITNVSSDHREYLGYDLASIAREKGGIIPRRGVCVTAAQGTSVLRTLEEISVRRRAKLIRVGRDVRVRACGAGLFSYYGKERTVRNLTLPLIGRHQAANAACALGAVEVLGTRGYAIGDDAVRQGLARVTWEGRLEVAAHNPLVVLDGAHNPAAVFALCRALAGSFSYRRLIVVFSVLADKEYRPMLRTLARHADHIIVTGLDEKRALPPARIEAAAREYHASVERIDDPARALARARKRAAAADLICVTGSLYLVGAVKRNSHLT